MKKQIKWSKEDCEFLINTYPNEGSLPTMKRLGITREAVKARANLLGIKCTKSKNLFKLKPLIEDSPIIFYWLGFIMADGYLDNEGELKISLATKDINHLTKLAELLQTKVIISKNTKYCKLGIKDAHYGIQLRNKLNIKDIKTYNPPLLSFLINKDLSLAFIAGFIDGDGTIGYKIGRKLPYLLRVSCHSSWLVNLEFFRDIIKLHLNIESKTGLTSRGYSYWSFSSGKNIDKLKQEFQRLKLPIMERKWKTI